MAKNLVNGTNIIIEESGDNINMNLSSAYTSSLNNQITSLNNEIDTKTTYSATETVVGTWGGKPLYRKMYTGNLSQGAIPHGLTNFKMASIYGNFYNPNSGNYFPLPSVRPSYPEYAVGVYVGTSNIVLERGASAQSSTMTFELILEYTKTTD